MVSGADCANSEESSGPLTEPVTGMEFVKIKEGCFIMGTRGTDLDYSDNEDPVHEVCVSAFQLGKYEVTQKQWQTLMGSNPSTFVMCGDDCPVEQVSWEEVQPFIEKLNAFGKECHYRLPTETEWEYACRSGGRKEAPVENYCGSNDVNQVAWYDGNSGGRTHPVGQKSANGFGLHDMSGNVWEWVADGYGVYAEKYHGITPRYNPTRSVSTDSRRVGRGGSWISLPADVRSAFRINRLQSFRQDNAGFRVVRTCP
ncbi:MAG: formylglycine-generating enzyme family protein [Magnetococcales bacterium]|nr:formylglycine-generating enzyme family protein [Magnetococcales bacterium]MBF0149595.1 formylglycine-generating enzyme family protein [Magnetococcales bacterium]MBF0347865.1 formylglycine-generating enzyme family protein [Magnetococcales bacterium]